MKLQVRDIVRLISGGPDMVVAAVLEVPLDSPPVVCMWFDKNDECHHKTFIPELVELLLRPDEWVATVTRTSGMVLPRRGR